jgi:hypothetical protein
MLRFVSHGGSRDGHRRAERAGESPQRLDSQGLAPRRVPLKMAAAEARSVLHASIFMGRGAAKGGMTVRVAPGSPFGFVNMAFVEWERTCAPGSFRRGRRDRRKGSRAFGPGGRGVERYCRRRRGPAPDVPRVLGAAPNGSRPCCIGLPRSGRSRVVGCRARSGGRIDSCATGTDPASNLAPARRAVPGARAGTLRCRAWPGFGGWLGCASRPPAPPLAVVGAVGIQAAEARQVVHGAGPAVRSSGWTPRCVSSERYTTGPTARNIAESPGFLIFMYIHSWKTGKDD